MVACLSAAQSMALPTAVGSVLFSLPAGWTDVAAADPFVMMAGRRCPFTTEGLLALAELIGRLTAVARRCG